MVHVILVVPGILGRGTTQGIHSFTSNSRPLARGPTAVPPRRISPSLVEKVRLERRGERDLVLGGWVATAKWAQKSW